MATYPRRETEYPAVFGAYMGRIGGGGKGALLSHDQEVELGRRVRSGDGEARRRPVEGNIGLMKKLS